MFLGIDVGTSAIKLLLVDAEEKVQAEASVPLEVSRPEPLFSEQDPEDWWRATEVGVAQLRAAAPGALAATEAMSFRSCSRALMFEALSASFAK